MHDPKPGDEPRKPRPESDALPSGLEGALEAAYGKAHQEAQPDASVLIQLENQGVKLSRVMLRDAAEPDTPVVRPGTREAPGGRYQTVGEVARGGVGVILKCRDVDLGRDIAMKVLQRGHADNEQLNERFIEEAQIGGQLQHPGIVPVYELGLTDEKRPYFTMKFVKGDTLAALLANREGGVGDLGDLLRIFQSMCMTVGYAHSRGVIHRDLKPANILIGSFGEVMVVDWGFAKVLAHGGVADEAKSQSRVRRESPETIIQTLRSGSTPGSGSDSMAGSVMGTPAYMPPEQALGDVDAMDARSDVFGLGAVLCEILTGRPPYANPDISPIVQAARGRLDDAFARLDASAAGDALIKLCKACLDPTPTGRPADGAVVGRAVANHLQGVEDRSQRAQIAAITARRTRKWAVAVASVMLLGLAVSLVAYVAVDARNRKLELVAYSSALGRATDAIEAGNLLDVAGILDETDERHRGFEWEWLRRQGAVPKPRIITTGGGSVQTLELSPNATVVAASSTGSAVSAWHVSSGANLWRVSDLGHNLAWALDGQTIAALHLDGRLTVVDARTGEQRASAVVRKPAYRLAVSPDSKHVALTSLDGWVSVFGLPSLTLEHEHLIDRSVREICWSPDSTRLLVSRRHDAVILHAVTGEVGLTFSMAARGGNGVDGGVDAMPTSVAWSSARDQVLVCFKGGGSALWDAESGRLEHELETHDDYSVTVWEALSGRFAGASSAVACGADGRISIHDLRSGKRRAMIHTVADVLHFGSRSRGVRWRGPGTPLLSWGAGDRIYVFDAEALAVPEEIEEARIASVVVSSLDATALFYVDADGWLVRRDRKHRYQMSDPIRFRVRVGKASPRNELPDCCVYLPDRNAVAVINQELTLTLINAESGDVLAMIEAPRHIVDTCLKHGLYSYGIAVSSDEMQIACAVGTELAERNQDYLAPVLVYDLGAEPTVRRVGEHRASAKGVCFLPDGRSIVSGGTDLGGVMQWNAAQDTPPGQPSVPLKVLTSYGGFSYSIDVSADGRLAVVGFLGGQVRVYDIETGREQTGDRAIRLHESVRLVAFDPDREERRVLAIGARGAVALVDLNGQVILDASLEFARYREYSLAKDWSYLLATDYLGGAVSVRSLRLPSGPSPNNVLSHWQSNSIDSRGRRAAVGAFYQCADADEVRKRLAEAIDLPRDVQNSALAISAQIRDTWFSKVLWRLLAPLSLRVDLPAIDRERRLYLARQGLACAVPGSLQYGAMLAMLAVCDEEAASQETAAALLMAESILAAHVPATLSPTEQLQAYPWVFPARAFIAAQQGRLADAESHLQAAQEFLASRPATRDVEPELWAKARIAVEQLRAK